MRHWSRWWVPVGIAALVIAPACADGPDGYGAIITDYHTTATGKNVATHQNPADTAARVSVWVHEILVGNRPIRPTPAYSFTYSVDVAPHGTVNAIRILQDTVVKGTICGAAPCAASGSVSGVTDTNLSRLMRNVVTRLRVYTDSDPAGAASGLITPASP